MDISLPVNNLHWSHRMSKWDPKNKRMPIIVKFVRYNSHYEILNDKKCFKGSGISVTESLTVSTIDQLEKAREQFGFTNLWLNKW